MRLDKQLTPWGTYFFVLSSRVVASSKIPPAFGIVPGVAKGDGAQAWQRDA